MVEQKVAVVGETGITCLVRQHCC